MEVIILDTTVAVGKGIIRVCAKDKISGRARFNSDTIVPGILYAKMVISKYAHANIKGIDVTQARSASGVQAVITGEDAKDILTGTFLEDRLPIAIGKVRYYGEPIAVVIAESELEAAKAAKMIKIEYEALPLTSSYKFSK